MVIINEVSRRLQGQHTLREIMWRLHLVKGFYDLSTEWIFERNPPEDKE